MGGMIANKVDQEVESIATHFERFLEPVIANNDELRRRVFEIRHEVYCEELGFEEPKPDKMEKDYCDAFSEFCMVKHLPSNSFTGCVRVVCPRDKEELLPIQKYCSHTYQEHALNPDKFEPTEIVEISRLAVLSKFRRRKSDKFQGAATGVINEETYSEQELRCFPFISVGLYLAAGGITIERSRKHVYVMMEPRLARSMALIGIKFEQIGPTVNYHGQRAPYYINPKIFLANLKPGFKALEVSIQKAILKQL